MRDLINLITLHESVDFHPSEMRVEDGETYIEYPKAGTTKIERPCQDCEYEAEYNPDYDPKTCHYCHGTGKEYETKYNFPNMNVSNHQAHDIADMLGVESGEDASGWIPHGDLPTVMRRLLRLKNGDSSQYTYGDTEEKGERRVDRSGDVPRITTGPTMFNGGRDQGQINRYLDRLIAMVAWAQKEGCGISWA